MASSLVNNAIRVLQQQADEMDGLGAGAERAALGVLSVEGKRQIEDLASAFREMAQTARVQVVRLSSLK